MPPETTPAVVTAIPTIYFITGFFILVIGIIVGGAFIYLSRGFVMNRQLRVAQRKGAKLIADSKLEAKDIVQEARVQADKTRASSELELKERRSELSKQENRVTQKVDALERKLESLEQKETKQSEFALFQGKLCLPVSGRIEERFGEKTDPEFKTKTFQKGIDLRGRKGDKVRSVYSGQVVYADWFRGYGNLVIIDHGSNYYSLYAHLDRIDAAAGQAVKRGDALGTVGETGSLKGAYLYFELRHHSEAINPELWLNKNCVYAGK